MSRAEAESYFARYAAAYEAGDAEAIAAFFHVPCVLVSAAAVVPLMSRDAVLGNMRALVRQYREDGMVRAVPTLASVTAPAPTFVLATVHWRLERTPPREPWSFANTYNLTRAGECWKIAVSTTHEP